MAERTCPLCKKRPVWRTNHSNNWRHLCKRCYHKAWAADQKAQRGYLCPSPAKVKLAAILSG